MKIWILVATMSGTAEFVAEEVQAQLAERGVASTVCRMESASVEQLAGMSAVLLCSSSYGAGEVPDNGKALYAALQKERPDLAGMRFGVIALGDRSYANTFCGGARRFAALLRDLGAQQVGDALCHDAKTKTAPETAALEWVDPWLSTLQSCPASLP